MHMHTNQPLVTSHIVASETYVLGQSVTLMQFPSWLTNPSMQEQPGVQVPGCITGIGSTQVASWAGPHVL